MEDIAVNNDTLSVFANGPAAAMLWGHFVLEKKMYDSKKQAGTILLAYWKEIRSADGKGAYAHPSKVTDVYINHGIHYECNELLEDVLEYCKIPTDTMTLKDRISYYYLLHKE